MQRYSNRGTQTANENIVPHPKPHSRVNAYWLFAIAYALLISYGSLYPLSGWRAPAGETYSFINAQLPVHFARSDIVLNILVYMPVGLFFMLALRHSYRVMMVIILSTTIGILLSLTMEYLQNFLPNRTPSIVDLITNALGTFLGSALGSLTHENTFSGKKLRAIRNKYFLDGAWVNFGLLIFGLWSLMHLSPLVISLDIGKIRNGLSPAWHLLHDVSIFRWYSFGATFSYFIGLTIIVRQIVRPERPAFGVFFYTALTVLMAKIFIVSRQISLEQISALLAATLVTFRYKKIRTPQACWSAALAIFMGYFINQIEPIPGVPFHSGRFNWIPFSDQTATLNGISSILEIIWPFMAMAYLLRISIHENKKYFALYGGILIMGIFAFTLEWMQQYVPGRTADISTVIVAIIGWVIPLNVKFIDNQNQQDKIVCLNNIQHAQGMRGPR